MASRPLQSSTDSPGQSSQSGLPPSISLSNKLLSSIISLPASPSVVYATYEPASADGLSSEENIELARRLLVSRNKSDGISILDSLLPCVRVDKDLKCLYVFGITSQDRMVESRNRINGLQFSGLIASDTSSFNPADLYPCSSACASKRDPCLTCISQGSTPASVQTLSSNANAGQPSASTHLPRIPLRKIYSAFLDAARDRLIDDIAEASLKTSTRHRQIKKFKTGFLLGPMGEGTSTSEWGASWEQHAKTRPLIHCHLSLHLTPTRLMIHPVLRPTSYLPLSLSEPPLSGTPIMLMPYAIPAYFLTAYTGPTSALTGQFEASLTGLGVGHWKTSPTMYIIAWASVQNKQGEDKGMNVIWPSSLCLSYHPSSSDCRQSLVYVPSLPAQLQPSPPPPLPPTISLVSSSSSQKPSSISQQRLLSSRPGLTRRACTSSNLDSFRCLTLERTKDLGSVAIEVGAYVDSVAREREKERERIRREREAGNGSKVATPCAGPSSVTPKAHLDEPTLELSASATVVPPKTDSNVPVDSDVMMEHSYPSPPHTVPPSTAPSNGNAIRASPEPSSPLPAVPSQPEPEADADAAVHSPGPPPSSDPIGTQTDDLLGDMDSTWSQPTRDYMDVDFDMGFGMPINAAGVGGGAADRMNTDDFEDGLTFTDDDFSFFDRPSANMASKVISGAAAATSLLIQAGTPSTRMESGLTPAVGPAPFGLSPPFYGDLGSGLGLHSATPGHPGSSPWVPSSLAEAFTPRFDGPLPDLMPPSPGKTLSSHSAPVTPNVQFSPGSDRASRRLIARFGPSIFDPIPFAVSHRISDGKYASGKFSLPTPPDEEDRTEGWKLKYDAETDPRIGVVRKLKRKSDDQGSRDPKMSPPWVREREEWETSLSEDLDAGKSEESEDEELDDSPMVSRPSTPPPAYLPPGPSLLHTQFHHSELLPLSIPLRPPGVDVAPAVIASTAAAAAASVPTPVSPAAALGAASEKSKSLEAAAYTVAKEAVENSVWADAWRSNATGCVASGPATEVWQADVMTVVQLLDGIPALEGSLDIKDLFELESGSSMAEAFGDSFEQLETPMFTVGKSDAILQVLPTALRFWEKLGLGPRGGKKNVTAFALFEDNGEERQQQVERWLGNMSSTYTAQHLGVHTAGRCSSCPKDGIVPLKFDAFRKNLTTFVASLPAFESSVVFYLITPSSTMTVTSSILRQLFATVKRALKTYSEAQIVFQFVPEQIIIDSFENSASYDLNLERLCHSLYERILLPVDRCMSRRFFEHGERIRNYFQEPVFTLARPIRDRVKFLRQTPLQSLDVVDRHTLLHVGYQVSPCGKWIMAACVDQRGEAHDLGVWFAQSDTPETEIVMHVWDFALKFARRANVEWRIVFAKLGVMGETELDVWMSHLATTVPNCHEIPMMHVSILSVEQNYPWTFIAPQTSTKPSATPKKSSAKEMLCPFYVDASSATYALFHTTRLPLSPINFPSRDGTIEPSFIPDDNDLSPSDILPILPLSSTTLIHVPVDASYTSISMLHIHLLHTTKSPTSSLTIPDTETHKEITHNYHELVVLAAARWRFDTSTCLPLHLGALHVMYMALGKGDLEQCI